jgi:predicted AAA+ superfamily ATPase
MEIRKEEELGKLLLDFSPWWRRGKIEDVPKFRRMDFGPLSEKFSDSEVTAIIGARQVGKTTLIKQLIEHLLDGGIPPKHILYILGDSVDMNLVTDKPIQDVLESYQNYFLKRTFSENKEKIYIFIDEVQKIANWSGVLKNFVDLNKNLKFFVSGSSSTKIFQNGVESLVGRFQRQIVVPFKFLEAIRFKYFIQDKDPSELTALRMRMRKDFTSAVKSGNCEKLFDFLKNAKADLIEKENELKIVFNEYLVKGGYPKIITTDDMKKCTDILNTNIDNIIKIDIRETFSVSDTLTLQKLAKLLARTSSEKVNVENLSKILDKKRDTVDRYLSHLHDAYIIYMSSFYTGNLTSRTKKSKKVYINDIGMRNVLNNSFDPVLVQKEIGPVVETVVFNHCVRLCFNLNPGISPCLFYWQDSNKNEVDIVFEYFKKPVPVEVKYRSKIRGGDLKGLKNFIDEKKAPFGVCVTKDTLEMNGNIILIPAWLFLIMC